MPEWLRMPALLIVVGAVALGGCSVPGRRADVKPADPRHIPPEDAGPTITLDYGKTAAAYNPIPAFMYFVPLISPVLVDSTTSEGNDQRARLLSSRASHTSDTFRSSCEFEMIGRGRHTNTLDHAETIRKGANKLEKGGTLGNLLDYISFEGEGRGEIQTTGLICDDVETVTQVELIFNAGGGRSPVTIGLIDIKRVDGKDVRCNGKIARVNSLTFRRTEGRPHMQVKLASLRSSDAAEGLWGSIKGRIANLFIPPVSVSPLGNRAILDFGRALLNEEPTFTFPKARNLKTH